MSRIRVLSLYKQILRTGEQWPGPVEESAYIKQEARSLFKKNKEISSFEEIQSKIDEAESRMELATHYKNPYPRMYYANKGSTGQKLQKSKAMYMHSLE